jgi:hypothetical protein
MRKKSRERANGRKTRVADDDDSKNNDAEGEMREIKIKRRTLQKEAWEAAKEEKEGRRDNKSDDGMFHQERERERESQI